MVILRDVTVSPLHAVIPRPSFVGTTPSSVPWLRSVRHLVLFPSKRPHRQTSQTIDAAESPGVPHHSRLFSVVINILRTFFQSKSLLCEIRLNNRPFPLWVKF